MVVQITIPEIDIWSSQQDIENLLSSLRNIENKKEPITFDFSACPFISAEILAVLTGIKKIRDRNNLTTLPSNSYHSTTIHNFLIKIGFAKLFGKEDTKIHGNSIPIYVQESLNINEIAKYIDSEIFNRPEMPMMSDALKKEVRRSFFELFGNIFSHSQSTIGGLVCGQVYPHYKTIQIVFYDTGIGIPSCVCSVTQIQNKEDALLWALKRGTSTLSSKTESRGLGLYLLSEFIRINEGTLRIYSNGVTLNDSNEGYIAKKSNHNIKGTLIDMRIKIRDDVKYVFSFELNTN